MSFLKFSIFISMMLFRTLVWAEPAFIEKCETATAERKVEMEWLKHFFKVPDCAGIADNLSWLKSYPQFFLSFSKENPGKFYSWTEAFPEIYGAKTRFDIMDVSRKIRLPKNVMKIFSDPLFYGDFKNLTMLDLTSGHNFGGRICEYLNKLKHIKTILVDGLTINEVENCEPSRVPEIIILGNLGVSSNQKLAHKIVGIEETISRTESLIKLPNLRYVGLALNTSDYSMLDLISNQNITHLSLHQDRGLEDYTPFSELTNLTYLSLTCLKNKNDYYNNPDAKPIKCDSPTLKDISFVKNLPWLEAINLAHNSIENADVLKDLPNLRSINISDNLIKKMPDLSHLPHLKEYKFENNPLEQP